ncbi:DedA family protein [Acidisphaera sp. L21]|uniref:DedA family protein n=1 Tax=Acidisphaera sp. L21 TaxID=1641851 RepID=UPI0020B114FF|nr:DedA family protein [Acidisphaera sp. L21]
MDWFSTDTLDHLLGEYGYGVVFVIICLEAMGVPAPGESLIIAAAVYAATTGRLGIVGIILAAIGGAIMGDNFGYLIGRWAGFPLLKRYGKHVGLNERRLTLGRYLFQTQGGKVVFVGRFIAILRTFVALLAGANGMHWKTFLLWNAVGGVVWATLYGTGAYLLGNLMHKIAGPVGISLGIIAAIVIVVGIVLLRRNESRLEDKAEKAMGQQADPLPEQRSA